MHILIVLTSVIVAAHGFVRSPTDMVSQLTDLLAPANRHNKPNQHLTSVSQYFTTPSNKSIIPHHRVKSLSFERFTSSTRHLLPSPPTQPSTSSSQYFQTPSSQSLALSPSPHFAPPSQYFTTPSNEYIMSPKSQYTISPSDQHFVQPSHHFTSLNHITTPSNEHTMPVQSQHLTPPSITLQIFYKNQSN